MLKQPFSLLLHTAHSSNHHVPPLKPRCSSPPSSSSTKQNNHARQQEASATSLFFTLSSAPSFPMPSPGRSHKFRVNDIRDDDAQSTGSDDSDSSQILAPLEFGESCDSAETIQTTNLSLASSTPATAKKNDHGTQSSSSANATTASVTTTTSAATTTTFTPTEDDDSPIHRPPSSYFVYGAVPDTQRNKTAATSPASSPASSTDSQNDTVTNRIGTTTTTTISTPVRQKTIHTATMTTPTKTPFVYGAPTTTPKATRTYAAPSSEASLASIPSFESCASSCSSSTTSTTRRKLQVVRNSSSIWSQVTSKAKSPRTVPTSAPVRPVVGRTKKRSNTDNDEASTTTNTSSSSSAMKSNAANSSSSCANVANSNSSSHAAKDKGTSISCSTSEEESVATPNSPALFSQDKVLSTSGCSSDDSSGDGATTNVKYESLIREQQREIEEWKTLSQELFQLLALQKGAAASPTAATSRRTKDSPSKCSIGRRTIGIQTDPCDSDEEEEDHSPHFLSEMVPKYPKSLPSNQLVGASLPFYDNVTDRQDDHHPQPSIEQATSPTSSNASDWDWVLKDNHRRNCNAHDDENDTNDDQEEEEEDHIGDLTLKTSHSSSSCGLSSFSIASSTSSSPRESLVTKGWGWMLNNNNDDQEEEGDDREEETQTDDESTADSDTQDEDDEKVTTTKTTKPDVASAPRKSLHEHLEASSPSKAQDHEMWSCSETQPSTIAYDMDDSCSMTMNDSSVSTATNKDNNELNISNPECHLPATSTTTGSAMLKASELLLSKYTKLQACPEEEISPSASAVEGDCESSTASSSNYSCNTTTTNMSKRERHVRMQLTNGQWGYYSGPTRQNCNGNDDLTTTTTTSSGCVLRMDNGDLYLGSMLNDKNELNGPGVLYPGNKSLPIQRGTFSNNQLIVRS